MAAAAGVSRSRAAAPSGEARIYTGNIFIPKRTELQRTRCYTKPAASEHLALHSNLSARTEVRLVSSVVTSGIQGCWLRLPGHSCFERESASPAPPDWLRSVACIQRMQYSSYMYMYSCSSPRSFPQTLCECSMSNWHCVTDINRVHQWNREHHQSEVLRSTTGPFYIVSLPHLVSLGNIK